MKKKKLKIAVLMGGFSSEREISLRTGKNAAAGLERAGFQVVKIDVRKNNHFLPALKKLKPDLCFIALHGRYGEDGTVQGCLEMLGIPYTGSGVLSSALCMDKAASKNIFKQEKILTPFYVSFEKKRDTPEDIRKTVLKMFSFPVVVKPACEGSTVGITIVKKKTEFARALKKAFSYDDKVLVEQFIKGVEITCPVLGNSKPECLPPIEIISNTSSGFYDFRAKYAPSGSTHLIPPRLSRRALKKAEAAALKAHHSLHCEVFSRVDMIVSGGAPYVLEVNTIPGMTQTSLFPESARAAGLSFEALLQKIVRYSLEKQK